MSSLLDGGDMEVGAGNPWIPTGWTNYNLDAGDTQAEAATIHAGAQSMEWNPGATTDEGIYQQITAATGDYILVSLWSYCDGSAGLTVGGLDATQMVLHSDPTAFNVATPHTAVWSFTQALFRVVAANPSVYILADAGAVGDRFIDDVSVVANGDVSLTVTPASLANSAESSGLRIDGRDSLTQPITRITATRGSIRWFWRPRHDAADLVAFDEAANQAYILHADGNATNYIVLRATAANTIQLEFNDGGGAHNTNWNCIGQVTADTLYSMRIVYSPTQMRLYQDGILRATISQPVAFALDPQTWTMYWGSNDTPARQGDAVFR